MKHIFLLILLFVCLISHAQKFQVNGYVKDYESGEALINAHIFDSRSGTGTITNSYGFFSLPVSGADVELKISYVGYQTKSVAFSCIADTFVTIMLHSKNLVNEVNVAGGLNKSNSLTRTTGKIHITGKELESIPGLLGEKDIFKSLQLLPGIQQGREGTSGLYVRGGDRGDNLILLDGIPVYNINHLWGIFSVFTPEAVRSAEIYKGGFPARFGGRLSSVIDIRLKEGNLNDLKTELSAGTVSAKFLMEGPVIKGKSSFIISARRTYADLFYTPVKRMLAHNDDQTSGKVWNGYYFYDLNAKINFTLSASDRIYFSGYLGSDKLYSHESTRQVVKVAPGQEEYLENSMRSRDFENKWGNLTSSLRWNRILSAKLFMNVTLTSSRYNYSFGNEYSNRESSVYDTVSYTAKYWNASGIENHGAACDFDYFSTKGYALKFGLKALVNHYMPGKHQTTYYSSEDESVRQTLFSSKINSREYSAYVESQIPAGRSLSFNLGAHALYYASKGFEYVSIQPRLMANFNLNSHFTVKAGYSHMAQPLHLLVNNSASYPVDIWVPAVKAFKPAVSQMAEAGIWYSFFNDYEFSSEVYFKKINGVLNYRNGESFFHLNNNWENKVTSGRGLAYGFENLLRKSSGKHTGWIGYSLSWAYRQFQALNHGKVFPYRYDTRHNVSLMYVNKINEHIDFSVTWIYASGAPVTLSETAYMGDESYKNVRFTGFLEDFLHVYNPARGQGKAIYYSGVNNFRLPACHRLDAGINFRKKKRYGEREWSIAVYNLYNRNNPFFLTYQTHDVAWHTPDKGVGDYKNFTFFGILPSITYRIKID